MRQTEEKKQSKKDCLQKDRFKKELKKETD